MMAGNRLPLYAIEIRNLHKWYGRNHVLRGVNLTIAHGEYVAILGPNGAGKTTLMKSIIGMARVQKGKIRVMDADVKSDIRKARSFMGIVHQENNLDIYLSVMENLMIYGYMLDLTKGEARKKAEELLEFMEIEKHLWNEKVENLSGGTKRKLMIARALLSEPPIVIMDEPTTGLDPSIRRILWDRLLSLKQKGKTLLLTTHYMEEAHYLSDRVVFMHGGRIIEDGPPDALIKKHLPPYALEISPPIEPGGRPHIYTGNSLIIYLRNPSEIEPPEGVSRFLLRRTTLEDAFLYLTGSRL